MEDLGGRHRGLERMYSSILELEEAIRERMERRVQVEAVSDWTLDSYTTF